MNDYELLKQWIKEAEYNAKTGVDNLIDMIFAHYDTHILDTPEWCEGMEYLDGCKEYVLASGGLSEFDYEC